MDLATRMQTLAARILAILAAASEAPVGLFGLGALLGSKLTMEELDLLVEIEKTIGIEKANAWLQSILVASGKYAADGEYVAAKGRPAREVMSAEQIELLGITPDTIVGAAHTFTLPEPGKSLNFSPETGKSQVLDKDIMAIAGVVPGACPACGCQLDNVFDVNTGKQLGLTCQGCHTDW